MQLSVQRHLLRLVLRVCPLDREAMCEQRPLEPLTARPDRPLDVGAGKLVLAIFCCPPLAFTGPFELHGIGRELVDFFSRTEIATQFSTFSMIALAHRP